MQTNGSLSKKLKLNCQFCTKISFFTLFIGVAYKLMFPETVPKISNLWNSSSYPKTKKASHF